MSSRVRIVYRSAESENTKPRPPYYSKTLALASLLRAVEPLGDDAEIVFVNDGDIPADRLALMEAHGTVRRIEGGSNRATFRAVVAHEAALAGEPDDLVWFAEDDYLYAPDALTSLRAAADAFPGTDYFAMYGSGSLDLDASGARAVRRDQPGTDGLPDAPRRGAAAWFRAHSTTSTFGVRRAALRQDAALLRRMPYTGGAWDRATCLALQGFRPFAAADLLPDADGGTLRGVVRGVVRAAVGLLVRRPSRHRVLMGSDPELVWHMEIHDYDERGRPSTATCAVDWAAVAVDTMFWAADRGIPVPSGTAVTSGRRGCDTAS
ncbi:hypothetical protein I4I73_12165 [Pseudonocardia sp. KRD-184]|uniref:Glycosyl transferase family 2 n=1 Tax=Pseudonocardia oceani TaxID=2792013 RepID=A0ABS6UDI1_9PSEU|nr:hypothetical protein [Pseudonocardia oceani]MBW0092709.1 hypothetical protein [Pseudonocardia oceani]MBW0096741.1 hypothetical protein [Pseudonocardia oceani]MBW0107875.1 hypothetical protein [Pseudonocardia oceani]MBW0121249.1 hypothetical protein [Pseudonocardia oceani]MBW0129941.1 hypothetical protein [Pseudonocardia oceani]